MIDHDHSHDHSHDPHPDAVFSPAIFGMDAHQIALKEEAERAAARFIEKEKAAGVEQVKAARGGIRLTPPHTQEIGAAGSFVVAPTDYHRYVVTGDMKADGSFEITLPAVVAATEPVDTDNDRPRGKLQGPTAIDWAAPGEWAVMGGSEPGPPERPFRNETRRCDACINFNPKAGGTRGECRRYAPDPSNAKGPGTGWEWPIVDADAWCGEYEAL